MAVLTTAHYINGHSSLSFLSERKMMCTKGDQQLYSILPPFHYYFLFADFVVGSCSRKRRRMILFRHCLTNLFQTPPFCDYVSEQNSLKSISLSLFVFLNSFYAVQYDPKENTRKTKTNKNQAPLSKPNHTNR